MPCPAAGVWVNAIWLCFRLRVCVCGIYLAWGPVYRHRHYSPPVRTCTRTCQQDGGGKRCDARHGRANNTKDLCFVFHFSSSSVYRETAQTTLLRFWRLPTNRRTSKWRSRRTLSAALVRNGSIEICSRLYFVFFFFVFGQKRFNFVFALALTSGKQPKQREGPHSHSLIASFAAVVSVRHRDTEPRTRRQAIMNSRAWSSCGIFRPKITLPFARSTSHASGGEWWCGSKRTNPSTTPWYNKPRRDFRKQAR